MNFIVMQGTQSCVVLECYLWYFVLRIYCHLEDVHSWGEISDVHPLTVYVVVIDILAARTDALVPVVITFVFLLNILTVVVLQTE